jgi:hypothetical protein
MRSHQVSRLLAASAVAAALGVPVVASAQRAGSGRSLAYGFAVRIPVGRARVGHAPVCDGTAAAQVDQKRSLGRALLWGGGAIDVVSPFLVSSQPTTVVPLVTAGTVGILVGLHMRQASLDQDFWNAALARVKVGETRITEVRDCFGRPNSTMTSGNEETWTYSSLKTGVGWFGGGSMSSVAVSFKDGMLTNVRRTEAGFDN